MEGVCPGLIQGTIPAFLDKKLTSNSKKKMYLKISVARMTGTYRKSVFISLLTPSVNIYIFQSIAYTLSRGL